MERSANASGSSEDHIRACDTGSFAFAGGRLSAFLGSSLGDVTCVRVGERLDRERNHEDHQPKGQKPGDQRVTALTR